MFEFIKRGQLMRQGLSCGKTRRKHLQGEFWNTLRCNPFVGAGVFVLAYLVITMLLGVLGNSLPTASTSSRVITAAVFIIAAFHWWLTFRPGSRTNGTALLVFSSIVLQLVLVG